ncbi:MAG: glycosyltransferase family 2 protein [Bacteroidales bacterium]|nr:glycosyltransferase family 2 protein [Bacteroidales bacterium]
MEKQISIIIPTYNMENYIGKCLDSLIIPEFDQVEVLVVNDGSKDKSSEIAHEYSRKYPNSIRVIDKENGNYGSCINAALPQCSGRYVKILDADDTFNTDVFSEFVRLIPQMDEDVLVTPFTTVDAFNKEIRKGRKYTKYFADPNVAISFYEAVSNGLLANLQMHSITYKIEVFDRFQYKQTERISFSDTEWATNPLAHVNNIRLAMTRPLYQYLLGREGQTVDPKRFEASLDNYFSVFENRLNFIEQRKLNESQLEFLYAVLVSNHINIYCRFYDSCSLARKIKEYDKALYLNHPYFYKILGDNGFYPSSNYRFIKKIRNSDYSTINKIPLYQKVLISIRIRLKRFL